VEFAPVKQFPLDLIAGPQADGGGQGQGEAHVEPGSLAFGTNGLNAQGVGHRHIFSPVDRFLLDGL
jgi:hypothetical protein